jgi:hypothetical protein
MLIMNACPRFSTLCFHVQEKVFDMLILNLQNPSDCLKEHCLKFNNEPNIQKCMD